MQGYWHKMDRFSIITASFKRLFQRFRESVLVTRSHPEENTPPISLHHPQPQPAEGQGDFWQVDETAIFHPPASLIYEISMDLFFIATHYVTIEGQLGPPHTHSYRLQVRCHSQALSSQDQVVVTYKDLRDLIRQVTAAYNNQTLNHLPPFQKVQTTTENLTAVIYQQITRLLSDLPVELTEITIWESPTEAITIRKA